mmetsp:Transcript_34581/g.35258  ORF Transcript_34581/g.35258 Transcript_34581/m.35258 type:complete len:341 (-) Transcript_34581:104-1126(-)
MSAFECPAILSFGLIADTQYADACDSQNFNRTCVRRYRQSLDILKEAAIYYRTSPAFFCIHLGDVLDYTAKQLGIEKECLDTVQSVISSSGRPWYLLIGNHDYSVFSRDYIYENYTPNISVRRVCTPTKMYYDFKAQGVYGFRFICLDTYEISTMGAISKQYLKEAHEILVNNNPNFSLSADRTELYSGNWFAGLIGMQKRFVPYNGAISHHQLQWLADTLTEASNNGEKVFVFGHCPCYQLACRDENLLWNCQELLHILHAYRRTVLAYIAGHDHEGGYSTDDVGIHHITPCAPIQCDEGQTSFGSVHVFNDHFKLEWKGKVPSPQSAPPFPDEFKFPH